MSDHDLLITHATRWADQKKRALDGALLEQLLDLVTAYDDRAAQSWPAGSAEALVLMRIPASADGELLPAQAIQDTLDTYWRFLRATGRMTSDSASPAELVKELRRALPRMGAAHADRSNWSTGRVLQDFGTSIGISLEEAESIEEVQQRLDAITAAWNDLPQAERVRLMPDPSPKSARGATYTALGNRMLAGGDPVDDPSLTYPHYRRGIPSVAAQEGTTSAFARQVDALVAWVGQSKPVTATGVLKPALAQEAYAALGLHDWQLAYDAVADPLEPLLTDPEAIRHAAQSAAAAITRAADCPPLERLWYAAESARLIEVGRTKATPTPGNAVADDLHRALVYVGALAQLAGHDRVAALVGALMLAMVSPGGTVDLAAVKDARWDSDVSGYRARFAGMDRPEMHGVARALSDYPVDQSVAFFDDAGLWHRRGNTLTLTDFGREATVVLANMVETGALADA